MKNYADQDACNNCKHCVDVEGYGHFCQVDGTKFPVQLENTSWEEMVEFQEGAMRWRNIHRVEPSAKCDLYESSEK